jgi:superfamily I DNA/RNA helicase
MPPADLPQPPARLSAGQREAILAPDGPLLITAGPGTGKTLTVAERIAHLVTTGRAALTEILALTFSRVAARARLLAGERGHLTVGGDVCQNVYA